jgi:hypothetical protein
MKISLTQAHALAAAVAGVVLGGSAIASGIFGWREMPVPFVWLDVAVVYCLSALPLAASLAVAALLQLPCRKTSLVVLGFEALVLLFVPQFYIHARCRRDLSEAIQLSRDSRYGEMSVLLHRIIALHPSATWRGNPLPQVAANTDQIVLQFEERVAIPLPDDASDQSRIDRAGQLCVLGRTREAVAVLDSSLALASSPAACNLRGTICESQAQWAAARDWFLRARVASERLPDSPDREPSLAQAITGIAFSERKLGHLREAEAVWQELLALSPTADSHFLVARFYEDTQQAAKAQFHARQAIVIAPEHYAVSGRLLIDKLITSHFGCWGVVAAENYSLAKPSRGVLADVSPEGDRP